MIDWNDLRVVLAIARRGSLTAAARDLRVHQTTVGRRLDVLEAAIGAPLFLRTPSGLTPAPAAKEIFGQIERLATALGSFEAQLRAEQRAVVRIALTENGARLFVRRVLPRLRREHPEIAIDLLPGNAVVDVARGEADVALRVARPEGAAIVARKIGLIRYGLYAARAYVRRHRELDRPDLAGHDVLVPSGELARGPEARWIADHASRARAVLHASSHVTLAIAAEQALGLVVLPTNLAVLHPELELVRALPEITTRPLWLVTQKDTRRVAHVRVVANLLAEEFGLLLAEG